jgi:uncharacterized protein (TIGR00730 family)
VAFLKRFTMSVGLFFEFVHAAWQLARGFWKISRLPRPIISIFGGARFPQTDYYAQQAYTLAKMFSDAKIAVLTGGGPGIMEAATRGALKNTIGIGVRNFEEERNPYVQEYFAMDSLLPRKWLLTHYSDAYVVFPGGFGTLDEFSEILTLLKTEQIPNIPIILIGKEYWAPLLAWVTEEALRHGLINAQQIRLFVITDDLHEAFKFVCKKCRSGGSNVKGNSL